MSACNPPCPREGPRLTVEASCTWCPLLAGAMAHLGAHGTPGYMGPEQP